jgi:hypothetical protein
MNGHGFDGKLADHLRESLRFLQAGDAYAVTVNTCALTIIRLGDVGYARADRFCVVCIDCKSLVAFEATARSIAIHIEKHTEGNATDGRSDGT